MAKTITPEDQKEQAKKLEALKDKQKKAAAELENSPEKQADKAAKIKAGTPDISDEDKKYVHIKLTNKHINNDTKEILYETKIIKVWPRMMDTMITSGGFAQWDEAEIVFDPRPEKDKAKSLRPAQLGQPAQAGVTAAAAAEQTRMRDELSAELEKAKSLNARLESALAAQEANKGPKAPEGSDLGDTSKDAKGGK